MNLPKQEKDHSYRVLFEDSPAPMWVVDPATLKFLAVNRSAVQFYGYTESEFLQMTIVQMRPAEEISRLLEMLSQERSLLGEHGAWKHKKKDGTLVQVEIVSQEIRFQDKKAILAVAFDITQYLKTDQEKDRLIAEIETAEAERRKLEERYRTLFEESKDVIFISTPGGQFLDINPAGMELFGYASKQDLLKINIVRDLHADSADREPYEQELQAKGYIKDYELHLKRKDGVVLTVLETSTAVRNNAFQVVAYRGIMRDITNEKELQKQLFQAQRIETIGKLAGGVAHDFNNILMAISGYCELLEFQLDSNASLQKILKEIMKATTKGSDLARQLLAFSRRQVLEPKVVNLNTLLGNMEHMLKRLIGEEVSLVFDPGNDIGNVRVDPSQMEQVVLNLVVNSRDAMPGGGTLRIETAPEFLDEKFVAAHVGSHSGRHVRLTFSDTGVGIGEANISHIFEPFFTTKEKGKGTGLGLSSVYGIVKQSGGYITVESQLKKGTTFQVYLPEVVEETSTFPSGTFKRPDSVGTETILLVDDNESVRDSVKAMLQISGYTVLAANGGSQALETSEKYPGPIHLLVTDVAMPHMNGLQLAQALMSLREGLKILFLSGYPDNGERMQNAIASGHEFLQKPASMETLLNKIRQILNG